MIELVNATSHNFFLCVCVCVCGEFQLIVSTLDDNSLLSDQDINWFLV